MGQGDIVDAVTIEKRSLLPTHRSIKQGPLAIELDFKSSKVSGTMSMNGQTQPIALDAGGVIFADGAGAYDVIAALPLAEGYSTGFRNLDIQKQKVGMKQLKVLGSESVTVPAGTFEAFKVEITSADNDVDKTIVWIAKDTRRVLKISAVLAALNGGTLTSELMP